MKDFPNRQSQNNEMNTSLIIAKIKSITYDSWVKVYNVNYKKRHSGRQNH